MAYLRVMSWNVYQLPGTATYQAPRLEPILAAIARYADTYQLDVAVLCEVFKEEAYAAIAARLFGPGRRFAYMSPRPTGVFGGLNDGGVVVLARNARTLGVEVYAASASVDTFATKGFVAVDMTKNSRRFVVCGTHLQASYHTAPDGSGNDAEAFYRRFRRRQLEQLARFVAPHRASRTLVVAGDLNVDTAAGSTPFDAAEWTEAIGILDARPSASWYPGPPLRATYEPRRNVLARITCEGDCRARLYDHVLVGQGPGQALVSRRWIAQPQSPSEWARPAYVSLQTADGNGNTTTSLSNVIFYDLSDHDPIFTEIEI